jgi:hypothetical protein
VQKTQRTAEGCHIFLTRVNPVLPINANDLKNEDPDPILSSKRGDLLPEGPFSRRPLCKVRQGHSLGDDMQSRALKVQTTISRRPMTQSVIFVSGVSEPIVFDSHQFFDEGC